MVDCSGRMDGGVTPIEENDVGGGRIRVGTSARGKTRAWNGLNMNTLLRTVILRLTDSGLRGKVVPVRELIDEVLRMELKANLQT